MVGRRQIRIKKCIFLLIVWISFQVLIRDSKNQIPKLLDAHIYYMQNIPLFGCSSSVSFDDPGYVLVTGDPEPIPGALCKGVNADCFKEHLLLL